MPGQRHALWVSRINTGGKYVGLPGQERACEYEVQRSEGQRVRGAEGQRVRGSEGQRGRGAEGKR